VIDACLLAGSVAVFLHLQTISQQHHFKQSTPIKLPKAPQSLLHITEQAHLSETEMWQAWLQWVDTTDSAQGNCQFTTQTPSKTDGPAFQMICQGGSSERYSVSSLSTVAKENTEARQIFVKSVIPPDPPEFKKRPVKTPRTQAETETLTIKGWIETPNGKKYFDPVSKRWLN
jgi:hypothetical protein